MRADARRNRALIVDAAAGLFAARGPEVSMEEIAQAAGLGVGTLYRHFPDRRALLEEIAAGALRTLLDVARDHAARPVSRWDALLACVRRGADLPLALTKSLSDGAEAHPELGPLVRDLDAVLEDLAGGAQREGAVRDDITPRQVVGLLSVAVCRPGARPDDALTIVILDGLRTRVASCEVRT
ncbi:TetR/AcrR family transcriptional regulator [Microbispora hainanensis]|uniref:TetR/AcrR family transcriptional regulator n=1 Tax=Microbispora hainanensis TaxID=568844 RepID=A0ABZ1T0U6_9ACTN|nr:MULTISPECIES: helix-turn-helix domain-containing protein [Microbispora]NJP28005.1 helix-turn-helix transcriptional regulator [Microbispora sp. CL1-1]TQS10356.1 helix-turn-helix transcriptional regulator [Microbispora sp. SCL1-1]